jgi:uncharacterized protein
MTMKIRVEQIQDKALTLRIDEPFGAFPLLSALQDEHGCSFKGNVTGAITVMREFDHLRVTGTVGITAGLVCSRCLAAYDMPLESDFTIFFSKAASQQEVMEEDEVELDEQALVSATYTGDEIDLAHELEAQIAMEVPYKPLCSDACKGLCPSCGTDLNMRDCTCIPDKAESKFSALKTFKALR